MTLQGRRITLTIAAIASFALIGPVTHQRPASAEDQILQRLERTEHLLQETQAELQLLKDSDVQRREWEEDVIERLPTLDSSNVHSVSDSSTLGEYSYGGCDCGGKCDCLDVADYAKHVMPLSTDCGYITFKPGVRLQPRYAYDGFEGNNDFFIRRFRLKGSGTVFDIARYGTELKIDSTSKFGSAKNPTPVVENAWLDFTLLEDLSYLRVGLYDLPFSRNALTSDSKLLLMDRSLIKGALTTLGFADNTVGLLFHGRPNDGRWEYDIGIFDNFSFERFGAAGTRESDQLMPAGRIAYNFLDSEKPGAAYADYRGSYIGKGQRLAVGANAVHLGNAVDGADDFDVNAFGVDVFFNSGPWTAQAEYDRYEQHRIGPNTEGDGWYVQGGYLLNYDAYLNCDCHYALELAARFQMLDSDKLVFDDRLRWTSIGLNYYIREHNLKIQTDYTIKREEVVNIDNDEFKVQLQLDF